LTAVFGDAIVPHSEEASLCRLAYNLAPSRASPRARSEKCNRFFSKLTMLKPIAPAQKELKP
jgi:hypothetical protein